jgi:hypothetical protein
MHERQFMEIKQLAASLVKAQSAMSGAKKDANNPFFKSKYADLPSVMAAIRPALADNGLGFVQVCHDADNAAKVETIIIHESGESLSCGTISVPVSKNDAQAYGSAITYAKRYSLQAAFGVPSVDDDGNSAAAAPPKITPTAGAWESLDNKTQADLMVIANDAIHYLNSGEDTLAANVIIDANLDADKKVALWTRFDSKQRSKLKAAQEQLKQPNQTKGN